MGTGGALRRERIKVMASAALLARQTGVARIRYEDLASEPRAAVRVALGPGLAGAIAWRGVRAFSPDPNYHSLSGNPDRFSTGDIAIRPPEPTDERIAA